MNSSRLEKFNQSWKEQWAVMVGRHYDERMDYRNESETKKHTTIENTRVQLEILRNKDHIPADFDVESRKLTEDRDAILESIDKQYKERMRIIEESQQKEQANHEKARIEALANRSSMDSALSVHPAFAPTATTSGTGTANRGDTAPIYHTPARKSPGLAYNWIPPVEDVISKVITAGPQEQDRLGMSERGFSASFQREFAADGTEQFVLRYKTKNRKALQESIESQAKRTPRINTSVEPLPTPVSKASTTGDEPGALRTITFDEVYQNGQAEHKDTIVEFPPNTRKWYILKCEEHGIRFGQRPMPGAAKHLSGQLHKSQTRSNALAIELLGYRVIGCNQQLAELNNDVVRRAFASGYKPKNTMQKVNRVSETSKNMTQGASDDVENCTEAITNLSEKGVTLRTDVGRESSLPSSQRRLKICREGSKIIITNPKTFHVYYCFWSPERRVYPAMILGWDDQKPGGLEKSLVTTGLLDKEKSSPPSCYIYKYAEGSTNAAIVGWAPGFEDGGRRVEDRKFPVMFFDKKSKVTWGWVSAKCLSKFPLYKQDPPKKRDHPFNAARRWIAKKDGFDSWEEFEGVQKGSTKEVRSGSITTPPVSPITDIENCSDDSGTEGPARSSISNVTQEELQEIQDTAGEIDGDSDYANLAVDSSLEDEYNSWQQPEDDGRPRAFYDLRKVGCAKTRPVTLVREAELKTTEAELSSMSDPVPELTGTSIDDSRISPSYSTFTKVHGKEATHTRDDLGTSSYQGNLGHECTQEDGLSAKQGMVPSLHTTRTNDQNDAEGGVSGSLYSPTDLSNTSLPSIAELEEDPKGVKRVRHEENTRTDASTPRHDKAKRAKLDMDTPDDRTARSAVLEQAPTPVSPVVHPLLPRVPLGPTAFELSFYSKGSLSWNRETEEPPIGLYYGEGERVVGTIDGLVKIVIDPTTLRGFLRDEIRGSNGNSTMTLLAKKSGDASVKIVFDRVRGSKIDIGKIQVRSFIRWLRSVNPAIQLL
ncbi:hypothetical protein GQX73_g6142 [Xylaria multiplex]|uniref:Uncharacterized protein n=1 Tax=Xylaria multiplex TaxID=323545 RepID=A0A7C8IQV5_9PEZI|nr:hypothetical protein GQX73_g6142 [Xylaria multiplex]